MEGGRPVIMAEPSTRVEGLTIDSLNYVDNDIDDPAVRDAVDKLILDEMALFDAPDYLEDMPLVSDSKLLPGVAAEMARLARGESAAPQLDASTFTTVTAPTSADSVEEWKRSVERAHVAVESQTLRSINLELMSRYGVDAWKAHVEALDRVHAVSKARVAALQAKVDAVNAARKSKQETAAARLRALQKKVDDVTMSNIETEMACADAQKEVLRLKQLARSAGLLGDS